MKTKRIFLLAVALLLTALLACSSVSSLLATPTPAPTFTPLPTSTPVATSTPVPTATTEGVLFEMGDFDRAGCFAFSSGDEVERFEKDGAFHISIKTPGYIAWALCDSTPFSDFVYEADITQVNSPDNNAYGLAFRYDSTAEEFYVFNISGDGYYSFGVDGINRTSPDILLDWKQSSAINQGDQATNHIKIVAVGSKFQFFVNDQLVDQAEDSRYTSGDIGFFGYAPDEGAAEFSFDNVKVSNP